MLERLARFCYRRRRLVVLAWVGTLVLVGFLSKTAGGKDTTNFSLPGTESQQAVNLLKARFPARSGDTADIVFSAPGAGGIDAARGQIEAAVAAAQRANPHISAVASPFGPQGVREVSADHHVAFAEVQLDVSSNTLPRDAGASIESAVRAATRPGPGLQVAFGGYLFSSRTPPGGTEAVGLLAAVVILLIAFGSLLAMAMPLLTAVFSIVIGLGLIALLANVMEIATFTNLITAMIGIGVGIDYALFIVTRYRQGLHDGLPAEEAIGAALATSGRAVLFAGCTVVIALMGMFLMGLSFVNGLAVGAAFAVLITMAASVTLLPAMLGFAGPNIDRLHLPRLHRSASSSEARNGFWFRWSRTIQRRPWPFALAALALLLVLAFPVTSLKLGFPDAGNDPKGTTTRQAYDMLAKGFGPGYNGPLIVAVSLPRPGDLAVAQRLDDALRADPGTAATSPVQPNSRTAPTAAVITVTPRTAPQDGATGTWVRHIRRDVITPVVAGTDVVAKTTGNASFNIDVTKKLSSRLPLFFGAVIALSFLLLMAVFRSVLVPLKAAIMNLLSIGAAFGVLVAVFEWGWGASIIGVAKQPIASFSPMMLFAILFGLSMDYEVFLLSRVKEEHDRTGDNALAVADGLASTARVITAAAAIMVTVFFTFLFQTDTVAKLFGLGLGVAILVDATVVRMVLVPSTMELLGEANWWLPGWLRRALPELRVERQLAPVVSEEDTEEEREPALAG
ncbi:MAG TPA: MMPL family transporter [Acidimicrobiales bacterium]|nr:MMPL family transporter [Acidimicrobiales bacterium]